VRLRKDATSVLPKTLQDFFKEDEPHP